MLQNFILWFVNIGVSSVFMLECVMTLWSSVPFWHRLDLIFLLQAIKLDLVGCRTHTMVSGTIVPDFFTMTQNDGSHWYRQSKPFPNICWAYILKHDYSQIEGFNKRVKIANKTCWIENSHFYLNSTTLYMASFQTLFICYWPALCNGRPWIIQI